MAKRNLNGAGSLYQRSSDGRWVGAVTTPLGRRTVSAKTAEEAQRKLDQLRRQVADGLSIGEDKRLGPWLDWFTEAVVAKKDPNTQENYRWTFGKLAPLYNKRLRQLTPDHVEGLLKTLKAQGLGESSLNRVRTNLGAALVEAERRRLVPYNAARLAHVPAGAAQPKERRSLTPEQGEELLEAARLEGHYALILTALTLGLRPGEVMGLQWSCVDLDRREVQVVQQLKRRAGEAPELGETKGNGRSNRVVAIPEKLAQALSEHLTAQKKTRLAAKVWADNDFVFCTNVGTPLDSSNLRRAIERVSNAAGLGNWSPNELRHSAGSLLIAAGVPIQEVADLLGHSPRMLMQTYRHRVKPVVDVTEAQVRMLEA
jgi:integrase